ncbi:MAG: hypothetical protein ACKVYV_18900 [Limisphaerales bacterium]
MGKLLEKVRARLFGASDVQATGVSDELRGAGTAFATLIEGVGKAVAATQRELDETTGHIATAMAKTEVDTVQATISRYDDVNGNLTGIKVITGKTSALSIAVPPALSFKRVHLEGSFVAMEFAATSTSNVNVNLAGVAVSSGSGRSRRPSGSASVVNANTNVQTEQTQDLSVATMSMTAEIRPKPVTALKKPPLIFVGPSLKLSVFNPLPIGIINPLPVNPSDPPYLERRSAVLQVELTKVGSSIPNPSRTIAIDCGALDWVVTNNAGTSVGTGPITDGAGTFYITVSRTATSPTEPKKDYVVRGSLNLVNATLSVSL